MSERRWLIAVLAVVTVFVASAAAQDEKNEVAGIIGRTYISKQAIQGANFFDPNIRFERALRRFWRGAGAVQSRRRSPRRRLQPRSQGLQRSLCRPRRAGEYIPHDGCLTVGQLRGRLWPHQPKWRNFVWSGESRQGHYYGGPSVWDRPGCQDQAPPIRPR